MSPSSSDTESEPDEPSQCPLPEFTVAPPSADLTGNEVDVYSIITKLKSIDIHLLESHRTMDDEVLSLYGTLVAFLDQFSDEPRQPGLNISTQLVAYAALVDVSTMSHLFALRALYRRLAVGPANSLPSNAAGVVSWVDVILAKIAQATLTICEGLRVDSVRTEREQSFKPQLGDRLVQAASQLPSNWDSVAKIIDSRNSSPAARRLALVILFASLIVSPQITGEADDRPIRDSVYEHVHGYLLQVGAGLSTRANPPDADKMRDEDRVSVAMALALYAETQSETASEAFTPHTNATLLDLLDHLFMPPPSSDGLSMPSMEEPDAARTIITRWCQVVPWSWRTWSSNTYTYGKSLISLSSSWLYYLNQPLFTSCNALKAEIHFPPIVYANAEHALVFCVRLLQELMQSMAPPSRPSTTTQIVLHRACLLIAELCRQSPAPNPRCPALDEQMADRLTRIFVLTKEENDLLAQTKELILEALVLLEPSPRTSGLRAGFAGIERFAARIDHLLSRARSALSTYKDDTEFANAAHGMKRCLQFLSIVLRSGLHEQLNVQGIQSTLFSVISLLAQEDKKTVAIRQILCPSLFVCLAVFQMYTKAGRTWKADFVWKLALFKGDQETRLVAASCFSHVILSGKDTMFACSPPLCARAWGELRDVLLSIIAHDFIRDAELLGIAVCSTVCRALIVMLECSPPGAAAFIVGSPWLLSVHNALAQVLRGSEQGDSTLDEDKEYCATLRAHLEESGGQLLCKISRLLHLKHAHSQGDCEKPLREQVCGWFAYSGGTSSALLLVERYACLVE